VHIENGQEDNIHFKLNNNSSLIKFLILFTQQIMFQSNLKLIFKSVINKSYLINKLGNKQIIKKMIFGQNID